mgnify:CR=1 FL=1
MTPSRYSRQATSNAFASRASFRTGIGSTRYPLGEPASATTRRTDWRRAGFSGRNRNGPSPAPPHLDLKQRPHRVCPRRAARFKAAKIMRADQGLRRAVHPLGIQSLVNVPGVANPENIADRSVVDHIAIAFSSCVVRCMEACGGFLRGDHGHVVRQLRVQCPLKNLGRQAAAGRETDDLPQGMYARIRAPTGDGADRLSGDPAQGVFYGALDRWASGLILPAAIGSAVVGNRQLDPPHSTCRRVRLGERTRRATRRSAPHWSPRPCAGCRSHTRTPARWGSKDLRGCGRQTPRRADRS